MERSNTHPITDEDDTYKGRIGKIVICRGREMKFRPSTRIDECEGCAGVCEECETLLICEPCDEDEEEEDEDDWEDITHCHLTYTKKNNIVKSELQMAGGGSHAWWYVLSWDNCEDEPDVYIKTLNEVTHTQKTLIVRQEQWGQSVKLVEFDSELREENDEYHYHRFTITDDLYDAVEEEEEDEICGQDGCDCMLCEDTPIMCYSNEEGDLTLCNNCYWDNDYWRHDKNEDNELEIKDYICDKLRNDPNFVS